MARPAHKDAIVVRLTDAHTMLARETFLAQLEDGSLASVPLVAEVERWIHSEDPVVTLNHVRLVPEALATPKSSARYSLYLTKWAEVTFSGVQLKELYTTGNCDGVRLLLDQDALRHRRVQSLGARPL